MSRRTFAQRVKNDPRYGRPREGDLIYIPHVSKGGTLFEIRWVEPDKDFFTLGRKLPYYYEMKLEPFRYSEEILQTGVPDVDQILDDDAYKIALNMDEHSGTGDYFFNEWVYQGSSYETATAKGIVTNWDKPTFTLYVSNIGGVFAANTPIIGTLTGTQYTLISYDPLQDNSLREAFNNKLISDEGVGNINFCETNPFGNL